MLFADIDIAANDPTKCSGKISNRTAEIEQKKRKENMKIKRIFLQSK